MKEMNYKTIAFIAVIAVAQAAMAQIPAGYYASLNGKKGAALKTAVHEIIKKANVLNYGSGSGKTWEGFYSTDRTDDNAVIDRYSNDVRYFGSKGAAVGGMNIEHSFPKSWWGGSTNQAYKDLYNLMPCEQKINNSKSNYPMGEVTNDTKGNGCTKIGTGNNGYLLWEPADKWKGDFARGYMYMATAYQDFTWSKNEALQILQQGDYPTLQKWAYTLYIKWAKADKPDKLEIDRNEAVSKIQGNRNPFVDFPNLMEYIWGDSIDYAFDINKTMKSSDYNNGPTTPTEQDIYRTDFTQGEGGCSISNINVSADINPIWTLDSKYGWKGTAYKGNANAAEAVLYTPDIDLTEYSDINLTFTHAVNFASPSKPTDILSVEVVCEGTDTKLSGITWPAGNSWSFNKSGDIPLNAFAGKKIKIGFRYTSTSSVACTWEIKDIAITGKKVSTGITEITDKQSAAPDFSRPFEVYSINGSRLKSVSDEPFVIIRQDGRTWKVAGRQR